VWHGLTVNLGGGRPNKVINRHELELACVYADKETNTLLARTHAHEL